METIEKLTAVKSIATVEQFDAYLAAAEKLGVKTISNNGIQLPVGTYNGIRTEKHVTPVISNPSAKNTKGVAYVKIELAVGADSFEFNCFDTKIAKSLIAPKQPVHFEVKLSDNVIKNSAGEEVLDKDGNKQYYKEVKMLPLIPTGDEPVNRTREQIAKEYEEKTGKKAGNKKVETLEAELAAI